LQASRFSNHPGILAGTARREENPVKTLRVSGNRDLPEIIEVGNAPALHRSKVATAAMGGNKPEDFS